MPNHVTTRIKATTQAIQSMLNEGGLVDFSRAAEWKGSFHWNGVRADAENCAEAALRLPASDNPLLASLQHESRSRSNVAQLDEEGFEQFVQMLRNHRATGFLHQMDFARAAWGTKWNAYDQAVDAAAGSAKFDTAWACPMPVLVQLSKNFPGEVIEVQFADEDIGSNCGTVHLKAGEVIFQDTADHWDSMSEEQQAKWTAFAYEVKGWTPDEDEDEDED